MQVKEFSSPTRQADLLFARMNDDRLTVDINFEECKLLMFGRLGLNTNYLEVSANIGNNIGTPPL